MGRVGLGFELLDRFRGEMENPLTVLFVALHATSCLSMLSTSWINGVIVHLWIALEKCRQCRDKLGVCMHACRLECTHYMRLWLLSALSQVDVVHYARLSL